MTAACRRLTQEFKDELCREVIDTSKLIEDVVVAYGVGPETLRTDSTNTVSQNGLGKPNCRCRNGLVLVGCVYVRFSTTAQRGRSQRLRRAD